MAVLHFPGFQHFWSLLKALLDLKAPLESPELTGVPTAPTQEPHDNSTKVATTEYVDSAVAELVSSSPAALDTLKELSDAIGGDANFSTTMTNALALKAPLASPALTDSPTAPTQNAGDNSTKIATTAYADRNDATCVHLAGAETVSGAKTFTGAQTFQAISNFLDSATPFLEFTWPDVTRGTNPLAQKWAGYRFLDKAKTTGVKQRAAACEVGLTVDGETNIALKAYDWTLNSTSVEQIGIAYPKGGTPYTFAPTPATGDNSTKIATTAFVTTAVANEDATCVHLTGNETIAGTKTFSSTITGSVSGNAGTATKIQTAPSGTSWVNGVKAGGALVSSTSTSYGAVFNAPTKNYRVSLGTYPSSDDLVYLLSITNANVTAGTNTTNKTLTWNAANGTLSATSFSGPLVGNVTGNCSGSSGSCTGNAATATKTMATIAVDTTGELVHATMGSNDCFRIAVGGGSNAGWAEIATGDDYSEPIYVRQYQGVFTTLKRTATLLDGSGNTSFPGTVTANAFSGPLTGNVTGNCSGSSGSCTGNAKTATTLATARDINISDSDGTNTGTKISFNGSANGTIKLPATIKASITGSCSGNAGTATKLATARSISAEELEFQGSANFDGSGNIKLNVTHHRSIVSVGNRNNYPFHRIAYISTLSGNYIDRGITFLISKDYDGGGWGICRIILRTNNTGNSEVANCTVQWLIRSSEISADAIQVGFCNASNASYIDVFYKSAGTYNSAICRVLAHSNSRSGVGRGFTVIATSGEANSTTASDPKTSVESYATIAAAGTKLHNKAYTSTVTASDVGVANSSNSCTGNAATATTLHTTRTINGTNFNGSANITTANWGTARNIYIADSDATNTGAAVSVNGSGNATLKLPATIKASITGNCSGSSGSCTGNAKTATTLATARDINISDSDGTNTGTKISFNGSANGTIKLPATIKASITGNCSGSSGSCTGNAATATKLGTSNVGGSDNPIYLNAGSPTATGDVLTKAIRTYVGASSYSDIVQTLQSDNNNRRSCTIRCENGNGYNTITLGAHNESNGAPGGIYVKNTNGTIIAGGPHPASNANDDRLATTKWVNDKGYITSTVTFGTFVAKAGNAVKGTDNTGASHNYMFRDKNNKDLCGISYNYENDKATFVQIRAYNCLDGNSTAYAACGVYFNTAGRKVFRPIENNTYYLGYEGFKFAEFYCGNASIHTSDARLKDRIADISDSLLDAWEGITWRTFRFRDAMKEKGAENARIHAGLIAQEIDGAFSRAGLDVTRHAFFCHNVWDAQPEIRDSDGGIAEPAHEAGDEYALRYEEALCIEAAYQRRRAARAEARIAALEERLARLEMKAG